MADPITVQCPHCKVKLKLKAAPPAGKKVGCPKCKKPFPVKAPPKKKDDEDFLDALDDLAEDDYDAPDDDELNEEEEDERPARSTMRSRGSVSKKGAVKGKKGRGKKSSAGPLVAIIGGSVLVLGLIAGLVYFLMNLPGGVGGGGIRSASGEFIAFAPGDADVYVAIRPAEVLATPLMAAVNQNPQAKQQLTQLEQQFGGFPLTEVEHAFFAIKLNANPGGGAAPGGAVGGNPMMGMPGGGPPGMAGPPGGMGGGPPGMGGAPGMAGPGGNRTSNQVDTVLVLRLKQPYGGKEVGNTGATPQTHNGVTYYSTMAAFGDVYFFADEKHVVVTKPAAIERVIDRKDQAEDNTLLGYFAKDQHLTVIANPKGAASQASLAPGFGPQLVPNQNLQKLAQDISMVRLDVNIPAGVDLKVAVTCKTDAVAQQIHSDTTKQIEQLKQQAAFLKMMMPEIDTVLNSLQVNLSGSTMNVAVSVPKSMIDQMQKQMAGGQPGGISPGAAFPPGAGSPGATSLGTPPGTLPTSAPQVAEVGGSTGDPIAAARAAASRSKAMNNLKQVLLAFHNHHDLNRTFPPAYSVDTAGQPLLSWRVHVLPFLDQKALYDQFHLNEAWDSEHNKALIAQIPNVFAPADEPQLASEGRTRLVVPTGPGMAFEGKDGLKFTEFQDGTSNTLMAVEVASSAAVIWTKPDDLVVDLTMPHKNLLGSRGEYFLAGFADGAARAIKESIAADVLKALFTRKGGEPIPPGAF